VVNAASLILTPPLASFGLAYLPEDTVKPYLKERRLIRVLADCAPRFQDITFITRAGDSNLPPSPCLSRLCATRAHQHA
jgi:DNA-binding transcriptional LysR family regulator